MKIAVNTRLLIRWREDGISIFTKEIFSRITKNHPEHEFIFLFDRPYSEEFIFSKNVTPVVIGPQARLPFLYYYWFEYSVANVLKAMNADVFVSPDGYLSLSTKVPQLQVIHDLNFESGSLGIRWYDTWYYRKFFPKYAHAAKRIVTVSNFSKQDIVQRYGITSEKIDVVYNAPSENFQVLTESTKEETRKRFTNGIPYFVSVGTIHARKNIANLLRAFDLFKTVTGSDVKLLLAGSNKGWDSDMQNVHESMRSKKDIILTGRLSDADLSLLTGSALAALTVSVYEGFGIPMVEAMRSGVPVIASNVTALPEIAGDAALLVNPSSPESIADAMQKIISDSNLRSMLIEKGNKRAQQFSWDKSAEALWANIQKTV